MYNTSDLKSFYYLENGEITYTFFDTIKSSKKIDSGSYFLEYLDYPENRVKIEMDTDKEFSDRCIFKHKSQIDLLFDSFFNKKVVKKQEELRLIHKVGILLYGNEGTGKTSILKHYSKKLIEEQNAVVFILKNPDNIDKIWPFIQQIRKIQTNPIVIFADEFEQYIKDEKNQNYWKMLLDGKLSINNSIFLSATNYLENIPNTIKNRPSRFKYVLNIDNIENQDEIYEIIYTMLFPLYTENDIIDFSINLKGKTLDEIKTFCNDKIMNIEAYYKIKKKIGF